MQREGPGWRLAVDPSRDGYQALIGGDGWAIELNLDELLALQSLCARLQEQHDAIADQLMAEESIEMALEQGPWWLELSGDRQRWSLRFILNSPGSRGAEGMGSPQASAEVCLALAKAGSF